MSNELLPTAISSNLPIDSLEAGEIENGILSWTGENWINTNKMPTPMELTDYNNVDIPAVTSGYLYKKENDTGLYWNTLNGGEVNVINGGGGGGGISGPSSTTINALTRWSNTAGTNVVDSSVLLNNSGVFISKLDTNSFVNSIEYKLSGFRILSQLNNNLIVGVSALLSNISGISNSAIGYQALQQNVSGSFNIALGQGSQYTNISGSNNITIGYLSNTFNSASNDQIIIGTNYTASENIPGTWISPNYMVNRSQNLNLQYNNTTGLLSYSSNINGTLLTAAQPNITSVGTLSSLTISGNLLVDTDTFLVDTVNNRVGIKNLLPSYSLDVTGDINTTTNYRIAGTVVLSNNTLGSGITSSSLTSVGTLSSLTISGNLLVDTDTLLVDAVNNRIGIKNLTPSYPLDVTGDINSTTVYRIGGTVVLSNNTLGTGILTSSLTSVGTLSSLTISGNLLVDTDTLLVDAVNNRIGIKNLTPSYPLDVTGDINSTTVYRIAGMVVLSSTTLGSSILNSSLTSVGTLGSLTVTNNINTVSGSYQIGGIQVLSSNSLGSGITSSSLTTIGTLGNLNVTNNINTNTGVYQINNTTVLSGNTLGSSVLNSSLTTVGTLSSLMISGNLLVDTDTLLVDAVNNRVGIKNLTPSYPLDVTGDINSTTVYRIAGSAILSSTTLGSSVVTSSLTTVGTLSSLTISGNLAVDTDTLLVDAVNNRVGIKNLLPNYPLDVTGDINTSTNYRIAGTVVLSSTALGTGITSSSLTTVGTLSSLIISGNLLVDTDTFLVDTVNNRIGIKNLTPSYPLDVTGDINTTTNYRIGGTVVLSGNTLGAGITNSSLTSFGTLVNLSVQGDINSISGSYKIADTVVLSGSSLGSTILSSSLTSVGTLSSLSVLGAITTQLNYQINGISILSSSTLGSSVLNSSLTSVGTLSSLTISGNLVVDTDTFLVDTVNNRIGIKNLTPSYPLDVTGDINTSTNYRIGGTVVLSGNTLGAGITNSSLTSFGTLVNLSVQGDINTQSTYTIGGTQVLSSTALGTGITSSSLTSVGILSSLTISGNLLVDTDTFLVNAVNNRVGIRNLSPSYPLDVTGDINSSAVYRIAGTTVLSSDTLGSSIINSSLTSFGTLTSLNISGDLTVIGNFIVDTLNHRVGIVNLIPSYPLDVTGDINTSTTYKIGGNTVLSNNTLGSGITSSSLTTVGTLGNLVVTNNINTTSGVYQINGVTVISGSSLGSSVTSSVLTSVGSLVSLAVINNINTTSGNYQIAGTVVLSGNTLGSGITSSSLTSVGTLSSLTISGNLLVDTDTFLVDTVNNRVGIRNLLPSYPLDVTGDINTSTNYRIAGTVVLSNNTLGTGILTSSLTTVGTLGSLTVTNIINTTSGSYQIGGIQVLSSNSLGSGVTSSNLSSVGTLSSLTISGNLLVDTDTFLVDTVNNRIGIKNLTPSYPLDVTGDINTTTNYRIGGTVVLSNNTLGTGILTSSLTTVGTLGSLTVTNNINTTLGSYQIGGVSVLSSTTLGTGITSSSLTSVGTLSSLTISGNLLVDTDTFLVDTVNNRIGIKNLTPSYPLDVTGDINSTAVYRIGGAVVLSNNTLGTGILTSSLTSVGILSSLTISGALLVSSGTLTVDSVNSRVGVVNSLPGYPLDVIGDINTSTNYRLGGTVVLSSTTLGSGITSSSLTSVGTLSSLTISGNLLVDTDTFLVNAVNNRVGIRNLTPSYPLDVTGDINTNSNYLINGNQVITSNALGSGILSSSLTSLGILTSLSVAGAANLTLSTAAQPNITSIGTLSSLTVAGVANLTLSTAAQPNITSIGTLSSLTVAGAANLTLSTAAQPNITSIGTLSSLTITGNLLVDTDTFLVDSVNNRIGILNLLPNYPLDVVGDINTTTNYRIASTTVLNTTTLGSSILFSSLTSVGTLSSLTISGNLLVDTDTFLVDAVNNRIGIKNLTPSYPLDVTGDINTTTIYRIGGTEVLSSTTLGSSIVNSSLTSVGTLSSLTISGNLLVDTDTLLVDSVNNRIGIRNLTPSYTLDVAGDINTSTIYRIGGTEVLSNTTLGSGVTSSSLTSIGTLTAGLNIATGQTYKINGVDVLSNTTLGSGVTSSSLTSIGTLTAGLNIATSQTYKIDGIDVLSSTTLGSSILNSSLTSVGTLSSGLNIATGQTYKINGISILSSSTLGSSVLNSSLTSVGTLSSLTISGNLLVDTDTFLVDTVNNRIGIKNLTPSYPLDVTGDINTSTNYRIGGTVVLSSTALGSGITSSSLTSVGTLSSLSISGTLVSTGNVTAQNNLTVNKILNVGQTLNVTGATTMYSSLYVDSDLSINNALTVNAVSKLVGINNISPAYTLDVTGNINTSLGYKVAGDTVLTSFVLGSTVTISSLTTVGVLDNLTVSGNFIVDTNLIFADTTNNYVGINKTPSYPLDVTGDINTSTVYRIAGTSVLSSNTLGSGVTVSSLTSLGILSGLSINGLLSYTNFNKYAAVAGENYIPCAAAAVSGSASNTWLKFRSGSSPISVAGLQFSHFAVNHFNIYANTFLRFTYSTQNSDTPDLASYTQWLNVTNAGLVNFNAETTGSTARVQINEGASNLIALRIINTGTGDCVRIEDASSDTTYFAIDQSGNTFVGTNALPSASSIFSINSTTQGFLPPRMTTTQKNAISSPVAGLIIFDTTLAKLCVYSGSAWQTITST